MYVILCSGSNFNLNFIILSFILYKLSKAKAGAYRACGQNDKLFCVEMKTEG